jgi:preprotein translocase SecE subunit
MSQDEKEKVVRRIKAKSASATPKTAKKVVKKTPKAKKTVTVDVKPARAEEKTGYFVGAWRELRQVHWLSRRMNWKLTLAVILFSGFFALLILLCDWLFGWVIQEIIL